MRFTKEVDEEVPVLIVGGGGAGLTASMLLAHLGVEHLLVSARPTTSGSAQGPRAEPAGDGDPRRRRAWRTRSPRGARPPSTWRPRRSTRASPDRTRTTGAAWPGLESWGAGGADEHWWAASPWRQLNLPQIRLEPLLKARAEELSPGRIRFGHELIELEQDDEGVRGPVRDNGSGREYVVRASTCSARTAAGRSPAWSASSTRGSAW